MPDVTCPHCGKAKPVTVEKLASLIGKKGRCSACQAEFTIGESAPAIVSHNADWQDVLVEPSSPGHAEVSPVAVGPAASSQTAKEAYPQSVSRLRRANRNAAFIEGAADGCGKIVLQAFIVLALLAGGIAAANMPLVGLGMIVFFAGFIAVTVRTISDTLVTISHQLAEREDD